jgi:hypothetical protein
MLQPPACDADFANDADRGVAHDLVFPVGERHGRCHSDRIAGVDTHRVQVFDRADDHHVVRSVPHHLELELLPADDAALDQHRADWRQLEPPPDDLLELVAVVGDPSAGPAEREGGTNDCGVAGIVYCLERRLDAAHGTASRGRQTDPLHRLGKLLTILGDPDGPFVGADQLDVEARQGAVLVQRHRRR